MRDAPKAVRMSNYKDIKSKPEFFEFGAEIEVLGLSLCTHGNNYYLHWMVESPAGARLPEAGGSLKMISAWDIL